MWSENEDGPPAAAESPPTGSGETFAGGAACPLKPSRCHAAFSNPIIADSECLCHHRTGRAAPACALHRPLRPCMLRALSCKCRLWRGVRPSRAPICIPITICHSAQTLPPRTRLPPGTRAATPEHPRPSRLAASWASLQVCPTSARRAAPAYGVPHSKLGHGPAGPSAQRCVRVCR